MNTSLDLSSLKMMYGIPMPGDTRKLFLYLYLWYIEHPNFPVISFRFLVKRLASEHCISNGICIHTRLTDYLIQVYSKKQITQAIQFHNYYQVISEIELFVSESDQLDILSILENTYHGCKTATTLI